MQSKEIKTKENKLLDILKYICAVLVVASHCLPLVPNNTINFFYGQWFFRFCVPLFLISSGYFFASFDAKRKTKYIKRIGVLYIAATLIYLSRFKNAGTAAVVQNLILGYHHLWYLSALFIALCVCLALEYCPFVKKGYAKIYPYAAILLIVIGAFYDEYQYALPGLSQMTFFKGLGEGIGYIGGSRHALFFALPMLLIGRFIFEHQGMLKRPKSLWMGLTVLSFGVSLAECMLLRRFVGEGITCDITLFNYFPAVFLFVLTMAYRPKGLEKVQTKTLRKSADIIYIDHILFVTLVDSVFGVAYLLRFLLVWLLSHVGAWLCQKIMAYGEKWLASKAAARSV